jgi:hypothetical protein
MTEGSLQALVFVGKITVRKKRWSVVISLGPQKDRFWRDIVESALHNELLLKILIIREIESSC